jgi:hypothetical protein
VISSFLKLVQSQQTSTVSLTDEIKQVLKRFQESNIPPASQLLNSALQAVQTLQDFVSSSPKTYSQQFTMFAEQLLSLLFKCGLHPDEATAILLLNLFAARSKVLLSRSHHVGTNFANSFNFPRRLSFQFCS